jgi:hypothetical protein
MCTDVLEVCFGDLILFDRVTGRSVLVFMRHRLDREKQRLHLDTRHASLLLLLLIFARVRVHFFPDHQSRINHHPFSFAPSYGKNAQSFVVTRHRKCEGGHEEFFIFKKIKKGFGLPLFFSASRTNVLLKTNNHNHNNHNCRPRTPWTTHQHQPFLIQRQHQ